MLAPTPEDRVLSRPDMHDAQPRAGTDRGYCLLLINALKCYWCYKSAQGMVGQKFTVP